MRSLNILRSVVFAIGAAYLIFSQDHSASIGILVLQFVSVALVISSIALLRLSSSVTLKEIAMPTTIAFVVAVLSFVFGSVVAIQNVDRLFVLKSLVVLFAVSMAVYEFLKSRNAKPEDILELRISAGLGAITGLLFSFAPLDALNSVGFLSAYLAISAVQRAVWAASPSKTKE